LQVPIIDRISLEPLPGVPVAACPKRDLVCAQPVASATTGADGHVVFDLPENFAGYLQVVRFQDYMPALYFLPATRPDSGLLHEFPLLKSGVVINALAASLGVSNGIDPTRGHLMVLAEDCFEAPLSGVRLSSKQADDKAVQYYVQQELPTPTLLETSTDGEGGYFNFPVGTAILELQKTDTALKLTTTSLVVRAGFITVAVIPPMSR
jgi:hypothetical protein